MKIALLCLAACCCLGAAYSCGAREVPVVAEPGTPDGGAATDADRDQGPAGLDGQDKPPFFKFPQLIGFLTGSLGEDQHRGPTFHLFSG